MACNQLGLIMDPEFFENWREFPPKGDLPMVMDNIRCEENEVDITNCRHDGVSRNVAAGCRTTEVVGLRCDEPRWAGVRYSLLASPPTVTGQTTMNKWVIDKAGLFDFKANEFSPALQIDWNYHTFHDLTIKNSYSNGMDIIYNDLTKKPAIRNSIVYNNRRNGIHLRSAGITIEDVSVTHSGQAGFRYNPSVASSLQNDIVSWLDMREQPELEANNVYSIPNSKHNHVQVFESQLNQRKFLVAKYTEECPMVPAEPCVQEITLEAVGFEYGLASKLAVQIVNPASNISDEDAWFTDASGGKSYSARKDQIMFPIVSNSNKMSLRYTRSYGVPRLVILVLFLDSQEYLDRFIHVYQSRVEDNQYGMSSVHYSNLSFSDGTLTNRWNNEKIWLQKVNFTRNSEAVLWIHSPQHEVLPGTPIAEITYHFDNCSVVENTGAVIETHRDLFASANVFHWNLWSNTFANNTNSGISVRLPDTYDLLAKQKHSFWMTENRFENNDNFCILLDGYYTFANISSNNFTDNYARQDSGILEIAGMEKHVVMERNRFFNNWGHWMVKMAVTSHSLKQMNVPAFIQYNYLEFNHFVKEKEDYVDMWPRSYAVGIFGGQHARIHYNRLNNKRLDFELISGCEYHTVDDKMNVSHNWWGTGNDAEINQRIFDIDDWNTYTHAEFSPFYVAPMLSIDYWWMYHGHQGQLATAVRPEPSVEDLKGRMYVSKEMKLRRETWYKFPHYLRPEMPYIIRGDVIICPGATLTIEKGVEVRFYPGARLLILGDLVVDGTYWEPGRFKAINETEYLQATGKIGTRYKRSVPNSLDESALDLWRQKRANRARPDVVYQKFPVLYRDDPYYQKFSVSLTQNGSVSGRSGFLKIYNATTGEYVPSCDRQFTMRNAQVVCRELGYPTMNAYQWITPRWDYNPQLKILKTYMEPRECRGNEPRLDRCPLRLTGNSSQWMCMNSEYFNYIYCGPNVTLNKHYIGHWGGITFASASLELSEVKAQDGSLLRNVEIVGGGSGHNDSWESPALQIIHRAPILDRVNVTNSSLHGIHIFGPSDTLTLNHVNVTFNGGQGLSIVTANQHGANINAESPVAPILIPYKMYGLLDVCAAGKHLEVTNRILIYYKYDSYPVDCVKIFTSKGRKLAFRFLQVNLYSSPVDLGRSDALRIYSSSAFLPSTLLAEYRIDREATPLSQAVSGDQLAVHLRATAADGDHGFIAEVSALPSAPDMHPAASISITNSRFEQNDRGAIDYQNTGEMSPNIIIEDCSLSYNGLHLYGNISTSSQAVQLQLHNTPVFIFRGNTLTHNRGGLLVVGKSSSAVARGQCTIKSNLFSYNSNSTTLAFAGNNYQRVTMINNVVSFNYALYHDTCVVLDMAFNLTKNTFAGNTGLHTVHTSGYSRISSDPDVFLYNNFDDNLALGHGHQYQEAFGYQPLVDKDEFLRRPKRQVLTQQGISFDWWTHVGNETERYRSTVFAGSANQEFTGNVFNDPRNAYELTVARATQYDIKPINARMNYWGYPGTTGVASGKIMDGGDYPNLIRVDYQPVLESNTSLIEGDCPAGWFQIGHEEFKACYLYVGGFATYTDAVAYCEELDAFLPYMRKNDARKKQLAMRIDIFTRAYLTDSERYNNIGIPSDTHVWISGADVPNTQCGWLSARTGTIGSVNCGNLLPFVCEKGTQPYVEPVMWRKGIIVAVVAGAILAILVFILIICWCVKSHHRKEENLERKAAMRASYKLQKRVAQSNKRFEGLKGRGSTDSAVASLRSTTINAYGDNPMVAHRNMLRRGGVSGTSPTGTDRTSVSGTSERTYERLYGSERSRSASQSNITRDESYTIRTTDYSSIYNTDFIPQRNFVNSNPNPSTGPAVLNTFQSPKKQLTRPDHLGVRMRGDVNDSRSTETPCSTCPTESERDSTMTGDSTITADSWSDSSVSGTTVLNKKLLPEMPKPGTMRQSSIPPPTANYFNGSGRPITTSRSNPNLQGLEQSRPFINRQAPPPPERTSQRFYPPPPAPARSFVDLSQPRQRSTERPPVVETSM